MQSLKKYNATDAGLTNVEQSSLVSLQFTSVWEGVYKPACMCVCECIDMLPTHKSNRQKYGDVIKEKRQNEYKSLVVGE